MPQVFAVDPQHPAPGTIARAAQILRAGGLVAFPTETVYGLGANALDEAAVARIFAAKERPAYDPLIVHLARPEDVDQVAGEVPEVARRLWAHFAPGPLTLILPKHPRVPTNVTAGRDTVAVRIPSHPVARALIQAAGVPVAAPSANRFGHVSPTTAQHVLADLGDAVDVVLDAGPTPVGVESTILDVTQDPPVLLRPGGVPVEALEAVLGRSIRRAGPHPEGQPAPAPGTLPRHYAPRVPLWLFDGPPDWARTMMLDTAALLQQQGLSVAVLVPDEDRVLFADRGLMVFSLGPEDDATTAAARLFQGLRALEAQAPHAILARTLPEQGLGLAVNDRLRRAATHILRAATRIA
ncbi:MAG: threonylcarbamoyl-AMP synthase [Chloroflexi bacterium]|nr:threonylcarbamoyl-AMP synthase [Chloroflexota bacterium]